MPNPNRQEVWRVRFDPHEGDEIGKTRPAIVLSRARRSPLDLSIVVPVTHWRDGFERQPWKVRLLPSAENGLTVESAVDGYPVRSLANSRFVHRLGQITAAETDQIAVAVGLCISYPERENESD